MFNLRHSAFCNSNCITEGYNFNSFTLSYFFNVIANNYLWSPSVDLNNPIISNPFASPLSTTTYTVTGTTLGCSKDTFVTITVNPVPSVTVAAGNYDCQFGAKLLVTGGINYVWSPAIGLDSINSPNPIATPGASTLYLVTVTNSFMCSSTNTVMVNVDCDTIIIPDGFSPDDDGVNDILVIEGIEKFPGNSLSVFNRWGNIIYEKDNYDNTWDAVAIRKGIIIGEGKVPSGTYFFVLNLGEGEKVRSGYFIIKY